MATQHRRQVLLLNDGGAPVHPGLLRVDRDVELVVRVPPNRNMDLASVTLWTNKPLLPSDLFHRTRFHRAAGGVVTPDGVWEASLPSNAAGAFELYVEYVTLTPSMTREVAILGETDADGEVIPTKGPVVRFVVDPKLVLGGRPLPVSAIVQQTVMTRCLGAIPGWGAALAETVATGYNSVHFTPVQPLGESGSCYSIYDQLALDGRMFEGVASVAAAGDVAAAQAGALRDALFKLETEDGILPMVDIVLNHTASNSGWLPRHPDACFSLDNSPHLRAAFEFDQVILDVSMEIVQGKHASVGASPHMRSPAIVDKAVDLLRDQGLPRARLWEFYTIHVDGALQDVIAYAASGARPNAYNAAVWEPDPTTGNEYFRRRRRAAACGDAAADALLAVFKQRVAEQCDAAVSDDEEDAAGLPLELSAGAEGALAAVANSLIANGTVWNDGSGDAFCVRLEPAAAVRQLNAIKLDGITVPSGEAAADAGASLLWLVLYKRLVETVNLSLYRRYDDDIACALGAIRGTAHHYWLAERGGRGSLSRVHPINHTYFTRIGGCAVANNGFIWGGSPEIDFTLPKDVAAEYAVLSREGQAPEYVCRTPVIYDHELATGGLLVGEEILQVPAAPQPPPAALQPPPAIGGPPPKLSGGGFSRRSFSHASFASSDDGDASLPPPPPFLDGDLRAASVSTGRRPSSAARPPPLCTPVATDASAHIRTPICTASTPYLRRELVIWGDCVKLRYGLREADSPWLWAHMRAYVEAMAGAFAGFRIDNAHGTPLHVAAAMLDAARAVRPELYVCGELFTGSVDKDVDYTLALGFNGLIREAMQAPHPSELSRNVHQHGGRPVASLAPPPAFTASALLLPSPLPAIFFDCTHDNETPAQKRHPVDALPNAALVAAAHCSIGSVRGYDILVPENLSVVHEHRPYVAGPTPPGDALKPGLCAARRVLNALHVSLAAGGYDEVHVSHDGVAGGDIVTVQRSHPTAPDSVVFIARPAFSPDARADRGFVPGDAVAHTVRLEGRVTAVELAAMLHVAEGVWRHPPAQDPRDGDAFHKHKRVISGLASTLEMVAGSAACDTLGFAALRVDGPYTYVDLKAARFLPGAVLVLRLHNRRYRLAATPADAGGDFPLPSTHDLREALAGDAITLTTLSKLLYRCEAEERDDSRGARGVYVVPDGPALAWAGFAGAEAVLRHVRAHNDMGHPLCANVRAGHWLMDYLEGRLEDAPLRGVRAWVSAHFSVIKALPPGARPRAVAAAVGAVYDAGCEAVLARMNAYVRGHGWTVHQLALTSVALFTDTPSAPLLAPALLPTPDNHALLVPSGPSLAAGVPHFSTGFMRNWGRDTFISLRGLLLVTGRFREARDTILAYATVVRHGLVPNLMDGGRNPRYNARDATWWFLQAVQDYCHLAPEGHRLLSTPVYRAFPSDDAVDYDGVDKAAMGSTAEAYAAAARRVLDNRRRRTGAPYAQADVVPTLADVIAHILRRHAAGIDFVEWNAGHRLDAHMKEEGFRVSVRLDAATGVLLGGSPHNCGTWMDKMGESAPHGTDGVPATPRDGAPVEITGLLYSTLRWLVHLNADPVSPFPFAVASVPLPDGRDLPLREWADTLKTRFEQLYWVPVDAALDTIHAVTPSMVNKRGIYKDTYGSSSVWGDYQLRPNFAVAMAVAPGLFHPDHARHALEVYEHQLLGRHKLGVSTLDPDDWAYRPDYDNNSQADARVAKGFNYHQGPEWVWPFGYFLRARARFFPAALDSKASRASKKATVNAIRRAVQAHIGPHRAHMEASIVGGLPELTNSQGSFCPGSCTMQAWSSATLLDALYDVDVLCEPGTAELLGHPADVSSGELPTSVV